MVGVKRAVIVPMLVTRFLKRGVKLYPRKTAVVCSEKRFSYAEYGGRVNRLSNALLALGVKRGDRVSFLSFNCHRLLEAYYGVVQIGAILLPLNIRLSPEDFAFMLNHAEAKVLCVDKDLLPLIVPVLDRLETVEHCILLLDGDRPEGVDWPDYDSLLAAATPEAPPELPLDENDVAEIFYTSGTTGKPKGVMLTHRNLYANAVALMTAVNLQDSDVLLHTIPLYHVNGWGTPHALTWLGGTHVMLRQFNPQKVFELIEKEGVTAAAMVPSMVNALLNFPDYQRYDVSSFKRLVIGGAPSPASLVKAVAERFDLDCYVGYGLTETSPVLAVAALKSHLQKLPEEERYRLKATTGVEVLGVELRVVNERGEDVRNDGQERGEIIARGDVVMKGYWKDPEETNRVIVDGWFHTGDIATVDEENYIQIVDRKKDIIITGGENIAAIEIENALYSHPAVQEAAVIGVPDVEWGEIPRALVVLKPGYQTTQDELIEYCRTKLARFKVPKCIEFVEDLPKTATGRILKSDLREKYWAGYERRVH